MKSLIDKIKRPRGKQTDADGNVRSSSKNNDVDASVSASNNATIAAEAAEFQRRKKERQKQQQEQDRLFRKKSVYSIDTKELEQESPEMDLVKALENNKLDKFKKLWRWDEKGDEVKVEKEFEDWFVDDPNFIITTTRKKDGEAEPQVIQMNIINIATILGKLSFLKCILNHPDLDFNMRDSKGVNAIWYAAKTQNYDAMELLMKFRQKGKEHAQGCLLDPTYHHIDHGMNPLHMVVTFENYKLAELMLKQAKDNYLFKWNDKYGTYDDLKSREYLNSAKRNGVTTLQIGIIKKNTKLVKLMIDYGADVNLQDKVSTACPLYLAIKLKTPVELVDQLLYGSYPQVPIVNHKERKEIEMSPLFLAIFNRDMPLLKKLVELGKEKKQIDYMVLATCNNVPPLFYVLKRQEKLLQQAHNFNKGQTVFVNGIEKKLTLSDITTQLTVLQKMSEYLIQYDVDVTEFRKEKGIKVDQEFLRSQYNIEHEPEITILWKTMQLANYPVASLLLDYGLGTVDYQMKESGETCLLKALKDDIISEASVCINNEVDREEIIRFLLDDGDDWWSDPKMVDSVDGYQHSAELAMRKHLKDYMQSFQNIYLYNLDKQNELQAEAKIKAAEVRKKALEAYKSKTKPKIQEKVAKQIKDKIEAEKKIIEEKKKEKEAKKLSKLNQPYKKVQASETVKYRNTEIDKLKVPYDFNKLRMYESDDIIIDHNHSGAPINDVLAGNDPLKAVTFMHRQDIKVIPLVQVDDFTSRLENINQFQQQQQQQNLPNTNGDQTNMTEQMINQKNDEVNLFTPVNVQRDLQVAQTPNNPQGIQLSKNPIIMNMSYETHNADQAPFKYENGKYSLNIDFENYRPILKDNQINSLVEFTDQSVPPDQLSKLKQQQSNFVNRKQSQSKSESNFIDQKAAANQQAIQNDKDLEKKNQTEIDEQTQSTKYEVTNQINSKNVVREPSADFQTQPTDNYNMLASIQNASGLKKNGIQHSSISNLVFTKKNTIENSVFPHPTIIVKDNENIDIATPTSTAPKMSLDGATPHNPRQNFPSNLDLSKQPGLMKINLPEGSKKMMNKYDLQVLMMDVQQLELFKGQTTSGLKQSLRKPPNFELLDRQVDRPIPNLYENNEPVLPKIFNANQNSKSPEVTKEYHEKDRTYMKHILEKMKNEREFVIKQQYNKDQIINENQYKGSLTKAYNSISDDQFNKSRLEESYKISLIKNLPYAVQQQVKYMGPEELDTVYKLNRRKYLDFKEHESIVIPAIQSTTNQKIASDIKMNIDADHYLGNVVQKGSHVGNLELDMNGRSLEQKIKEEFDNLPHRKEEWQIRLKELNAAEQEELRKRQKDLDQKMQAQIDDGKVKLLQKDIDKANKFIKDTHQIEYVTNTGKQQRSASSKIFKPFQVKGFSKFDTEVIQLEPEPIKHEPIVVPVEEKHTEMITRARDYSQMMTKFQNPRTNIRMTQSALKAMEYNTHRYGLHQGIQKLNENSDRPLMIYDNNDTDPSNFKSQPAINMNSRFSTPLIDRKKINHSHKQSISQNRTPLQAQISQQRINSNLGSVKHDKAFRAGNVQNFDMLNKKSSLQQIGGDSVKNMFSAADYHANSYDNIHSVQKSSGDDFQRQNGKNLPESQKMGDQNDYRMLNSRSTNPYDEFERSIPQGVAGSSMNQTPLLRGGSDSYNKVVQGAVNRRLPQNQIQVKRNNTNQQADGALAGAPGGKSPSDPMTAQSVEPWEESFILPKIVKVQNSPLMDAQNKGKAKVLTQSPMRTKPKTLQTKKIYLV